MTEPSQHFRAFARRPVSLQARLVPSAGRVGEEPVAAESEARLVDLGLGGACLDVGAPLPDGTSVRLLIDAPQLWDPLELGARIVWSHPGNPKLSARVGVCFQGTGGRSLRVLTELLEAEAFGG